MTDDEIDAACRTIAEARPEKLLIFMATGDGAKIFAWPPETLDESMFVLAQIWDTRAQAEAADA